MKLERLKSVAHNIADSFACGIGLMIGIYQMNVFAEAAGEEEGFVVVDFLAGSITGIAISQSLRKAVELYRDALSELCAKHAIEVSDFKKLEVRFGTDPVYGSHFAVSVENQAGQRATSQYVGIPGRRLRRGR
jgi:hypothetical protein